MSYTESMFCSTVLEQLREYMGKYQITFQFWGEGNNSFLIEKDGVKLTDSMCHETPFDSLSEALHYLDRINTNKRDYNPNF